MSIVDQVSQQMKDAMRAKDKERLGALRGMRAAFLQEMKSDGSETLADAAAVTLLRRLAKQRRESIAAYTDGGRDDLVAAEQVELAVIEEFLPQLADEAQTTAWVQEAIDASGAQGPRDTGRVMGQLMRNHKGDVDGSLAKKIAAQLLGG